MDKYTENRFGYLKEKSLEELNDLRERLFEDIEHSLRVLDNDKASGFQKSEIRNSDLKFAREELEYVSFLIEQKSHKRSI